MTTPIPIQSNIISGVTRKRWINPLVIWVWIGGTLMFVATIYTMLPNSRQRRANRDKKTLERLLRASEIS